MNLMMIISLIQAYPKNPLVNPKQQYPISQNSNSMRFQNPIAQFPLVNLLLLLLSLPKLPLSLARDSQSTLICGATPLNISLFLNNFISSMESLSDQASISKWGFNVSGKSSPSPVYSVFQCFSYLSQKDCQLCFAKARPSLPRCIPHPGRILLDDGCFLRYDNYSFLNESIDDKYDYLNCSSSNVVQGEAERSQLTKNVEEVVGNMTKIAVDGDGFGAEERGGGDGVSVYGMAQCWESLSREECRECLEKAGSEVRKCLPAREGKALNAGCFLWYSPEKISNEMGSEGKGTDDGMCGGIAVFKISVCLSMSGVWLLVLGFGAFAW